jgi:hypothetical protein
MRLNAVSIEMMLEDDVLLVRCGTRKFSAHDVCFFF